jgi:hypothetical protein
MKTLLIKVQKISFFLCCTVVLGQNIKIDNLDNKSNLNTLVFNLAASKLCESFYTENDLRQEWQDKTTYSGLFNRRSHYGCHVCAESIKYPLMSPLETFASRFLKDKRIQRNQSNAFALRSIREDIKNKYSEKYNRMVDSMDTENLVFYQTDVIKGYSFQAQKLTINMRTPHFDKILPVSNSWELVSLPYLLNFSIDESGNLKANSFGDRKDATINVQMPESTAKKIFDYYSDHFHPNPPFSIITKIEYGLRLGKVIEGKPRYYQIVLKKAEFFLPNKENLKRIHSANLKNGYKTENKIAEVIFDKNLFFSKTGFTYQKIKSIK